MTPPSSPVHWRSSPVTGEAPRDDACMFLCLRVAVFVVVVRNIEVNVIRVVEERS